MTSLINFEQSPKRSLDLCANAYCNCRPPQGQTSTRNPQPQPQPQPHFQFKVYPHHLPQPINIGDGELIHMYYGGLCISWSRGARSLSLSIYLTRTRALRSDRQARQAAASASAHRAAPLSSASFVLLLLLMYIQWQAIRYAHFLYKYIRACI